MPPTCQVNTGTAEAELSFCPLPMARCPEGQGKGWGVSQATTCSSCLQTSSPAPPAFPSISLHWGSKPKVCTRSLGQHLPEGDIQVLVRPQAREDQLLQRLAHNAPGASDTCRTPPPSPPSPPALRAGPIPAFHTSTAPPGSSHVSTMWLPECAHTFPHFFVPNPWLSLPMGILFSKAHLNHQVPPPTGSLPWFHCEALQSTFHTLP